MLILKELWTKEVEEPQVKNSYQYVFELREKLEDTLKLAHTELLPTDHNKLLMERSI